MLSDSFQRKGGLRPEIHSPAIIMAFDWLNVTGILAKGDPATANQDLTPMLLHLLFLSTLTGSWCKNMKIIDNNSNNDFLFKLPCYFI